MYFAAICEVWVKPLFRKARPKNLKTTWAANDYSDFLRMLRNHYEGKRWQLIEWHELRPTIHERHGQLGTEDQEIGNR